MHTFTRILTRLAPRWTLQTPQQLMSEGSAVVTNEDKVRTFCIDRVVYDDSLTPSYRVGSLSSLKGYTSLNNLYKEHPLHTDTIILDLDRNLEIYKLT